jgi:hypothetical protein
MIQIYFRAETIDLSIVRNTSMLIDHHQVDFRHFAHLQDKPHKNKTGPSTMNITRVIML